MASLAPYGSDGRDQWIDGTIALGCQHLHETPESVHEVLPAGPMPPMPSAPHVITSDARLDNRAELCERLGIDGATIADSQIILAAYARWGRECPRYLLGDFSFAIWDASRRCLLCVRDPMGVKPFYYRAGGPGPFVFASDLAALMAVGPRTVNWPALKGKLAYLSYYHPEATLVAEVSNLPPGHLLEVDANGVRKTAYFRPEDAPSIRYAREDDYAERLRELLIDAVRCRVRSEGEVAAHLSGGLDSSAIAVLAARETRADRRTLTTYSYAVRPPAGSGPQHEWAHIAAVCEQEGISCAFTEVSPGECLAYLTRDVAHTSPFASAPWDAQIFRRASQAGARVLLSGWGGDELITGHALGFYAELFAHGRWTTLWRESGARLAADTSAPPRLSARMRFLLERGVKPLLPDRVIARLDDGFMERPAFAPFLDPDLVAQLRQIPLLPVVPKRWEHPSVHQQQLGMLAYGHVQLRMETWAAETAPLGLTVRYPLLDRRIVEFALGIPSRLHVQDGWIRSLFRSATRDLLPETVRWQRKVGLEVSMEANRAAFLAGMRARIDGAVSERPALRRPVLCRRTLACTALDVNTPAGRRLGRRVLTGLQCEAVLESVVNVGGNL